MLRPRACTPPPPLRCSRWLVCTKLKLARCCARPAAGTAGASYTFTLLAADGTTVISRGAVGGITGAGTAADPHVATLAVGEAAASGGVFRLKLTATRNVPSPGVSDVSMTDAPSAQFGLGVPPEPVLEKAAGGEKVLGLVVAPWQTVSVGGVATAAIQPAQFVLRLK